MQETPVRQEDSIASGDPVISVEDLHKSYGELEVLKGVSLRVDRGEAVCLVGPSGSGKSTLLRTLNGLETTNAGRILVDGHHLAGYPDVDHASKRVRTRLINTARRHIGMVFQDYNLFWHINLLDNITLSLRTVEGVGREEATSRARRALTTVGLADKEAAYPGHLSGGQQQRGAIARALAMRPNVMLFDEPTSALDPDLAQEVLAVMGDLSSAGMTMVVVTHDISFVRRMATRVVMLNRGRIVAETDKAADPQQIESEEMRNFLRHVV